MQLSSMVMPVAQPVGSERDHQRTHVEALEDWEIYVEDWVRRRREQLRLAVKTIHLAQACTQDLARGGSNSAHAQQNLALATHPYT